MTPTTSRPRAALVPLAAMVSIGLLTAAARAAVPPPSNDTPGTAQPVGPLPAVIAGSNVNGDNTIDTTTLGNLPSVPGPDVFYSFTPAATGVYWIMMIPWDQVPVYASSGGGVPDPNLCVYVRNAGTGAFIAGSDANARDKVDTVVVALDAGTTYEIVVDSAVALAHRQQFEFTLIVAAEPVAGAAEHCAAGGAIPFSFPAAVVGTLTGAADDFTFVEGAGRCDVADTTGLTTPGGDHVYAFTTGPDPSDAGDYVFNLIPAGTDWNGYVYVADSCPPFLPLGCLGAASHTSLTVRHAETIVVTLDFDKTYYVVVDSATAAPPDARYVLLAERADAYDINETEPNDAPGSASPIAGGTQNGGQVVGAADVDFWSFPAAAGDRLYAFVDNGNAALSSIDSELRLLNLDGSTLIEMDDDDGEGGATSVATFAFRHSSFAAALAGTSLPAAGTYYLQVNSQNNITTLSRYRFHFGLEPAGRLPTPECEPNDTLPAADGSAKHYYAGTIDPQGDVDLFTFSADAGDRIFVALDGDPERDSGGSDANSPNALDPALRIYDPDGDVLIDDIDDKSGIGAGQIPDYPAEVTAFVAPASGTYTVAVSGGDADDFGPDRTYHLAIFLNTTTPALSEDVDPVIDSVTPDFQNDTLAVTVSDDTPGDNGLCAAALSPSSENLALANVNFSPGDPTASFDVVLIDGDQSGSGKLIITDCAGNTACRYVQIDANPPLCEGSAVTPTRRTTRSTHPPIHVRDNQPSGPGINGTIDVTDAGVITDLDVTLSIETVRPLDIDCFLESPNGTRVELFTDRGGSTSGWDITDATFDDSAASLLSLLSSDAPYTGRWRPEDPLGLARLNGENPLGTWKLNVIDDANSATGGARLVRWSLDIDAGFPAPQIFEGTASDIEGVQGGIVSIVLDPADNTQLHLPDDFTPGDPVVEFTVTLINPSQNGSGTITVTDTSENTCHAEISLAGLPDSIAPSNSGDAARQLRFGAEVQGAVPAATPTGVVSTVSVGGGRSRGGPPLLVGDVETSITLDTLDVGRIASTLAHGGQFAALLNRTGMSERGSVGLTKDNIEITLDDDAPPADDAHLEPALGSIEFLGLHQPDGRGGGAAAVPPADVGNGITADYRDHMMFALSGQDAAGDWSLYVGDFRIQGASAAKSVFRRWNAVVHSPGGPERYFGTARDPFPGGGICSIEPAAGAVNLAVEAVFSPGDENADYVVTLVDPAQPGSGNVEITDCAGNVTLVPVTLAAALDDQALPVVGGAVNPATRQFEGDATDNQPGDSGIVSVELAPYETNLEIVSVSPDPPGGADAVSFLVGLVDPGANGRGYVRVTDAAGWRSHVLVHIDAVAPVCFGSARKTKRYRGGGDLPADIPDNNVAGVTSSIVVPDLDTITDVDITLNVTHEADFDIDCSLTSPLLISLFTDVGSTGNDFFHTTLDDEAAASIDTGSAPFTGSFRPEPPAALSVLDGGPAVGTWSLRIVDDAAFNLGSFDSWSLTIESATFPERFAGEARDMEALGMGVAAIELLPGACNLTLNVDPFAPGAKLVVWEVVLTDPAGCGAGTVRVTDAAGNVCDVPVTVNGAACGPGDVNHDGKVDAGDVAGFVDALLFGGDVCEADVNGDGQVDGDDIQPFIDAAL